MTAPRVTLLRSLMAGSLALGALVSTGGAISGPAQAAAGPAVRAARRA